MLSYPQTERNEVSAMLDRTQVIERFLWGISILSSYISFNSHLNYHDINIFSENFMRGMLNILYSDELINPQNRNNPAFDLISKKKRLLVQVTSSSDPEKVKKTFDTLRALLSKRRLLVKQLRDLEETSSSLNSDYSIQMGQTTAFLDPKKLSYEQQYVQWKEQLEEMPDLTGYTMKFVVLTRDANRQRSYQGAQKTGYNVPDSIHFDVKHDILDLSNLCEAVNNLEECKLQKLNRWMEQNSNLFIQRIPSPTPKDKVDAIIDEYANNFEGPLFLHRYVPNTKVQLRNLYVNPAYCEPGERPSQDIISLFSKFLWEDSSVRILYIDGDAAIGKTSLVSWLCYHYRNIAQKDFADSCGKAIFMGNKLICIRLRDLDFTETKDTVSPIFSYLGIKDIVDFQQDYSNAVIILDGIDELSMIENGLSSSFIANFLLEVRKTFSGNKLIVTGRPHFFSVSELQTGVFKIKHINLQHFDYEMRKKWIDNYESCGEVIPDKTKQYILSLDDSAAEGVADTPLALYLLVSCEVQDEIQGNRWALYHKIFKNAIMKTEYNENFTSGAAHPASCHWEVIYNIVCKISFKMFQNSKEDRYYISGRELNQIIENTDLHAVSPEWVRRCCVLCAYWKSGSNTGALEFYHNDIRDFFFCEYLYSIVVNCNSSPGSASFCNFVETLCTIFQYGYISGTTWAQTFEFLYLRLKYEGKRDPSVMPDILSTGTWFSKLFMRLFKSHDLYGFSFNDSPYSSIRRVLFNGTLLIRVIYQIWIDKAPKDNRLSFWENEEDRELLISSKVFLDWHDMFQQAIQIVSGSAIGVGSSMDLSSLKFCNMQFNGAVFSGSLLHNTNFAGSNLQKASFSNAKLEDSDFSGCDLQDASFCSTILIHVDFAGAKLSGVNFSSAIIQDCCWDGYAFLNCNFTHAQFYNCTLANTQYSQTRLEETSFSKTHLDHAIFGTDVRLDRTTFLDCWLNEANFSNAMLVCTHFNNCDLTGSFFCDARLCRVVFSGGTLKNMDFEKTVFALNDVIPLEISCQLNHMRYLPLDYFSPKKDSCPSKD